MLPRYFDIHSHLNFSQFDEDREEIIEQMQKEGVWTIAVGTGLKTSKQAVELAGKHNNIFATVGVHPTDWGEGFNISEFENLVLEKKVVGMGECGLDYFRLEKDDTNSREKQKEVFIKHIEFSGKHNLPLMLHGRPSFGSMDSYLDMLDILYTNRDLFSSKYPGNAHFFVGNTEVAQKFFDLGFTISFDGPITFAKEYEEVVRYSPMDKIMAETDSPFAAPEPHRGKRNSPLYVKEIYKSIAEIKNKEVEEVRQSLTENAMRYWTPKLDGGVIL